MKWNDTKVILESYNWKNALQNSSNRYKFFYQQRDTMYVYI